MTQCCDKLEKAVSGSVDEAKATKVTMHMEKVVRRAQLISPIVEPNYPIDITRSTAINAVLGTARNAPF